MKIKFILILFIVFSSCKDNSSNLNAITGNAIGTTFSIKYTGKKLTNIEFKIDSLIADINKSTSTYITTSDISKINSGDTTIAVDENFIAVFTKSQRIFEETNGFFDPTIGILVNAWGFGPEKPIKDLDSVKINELLKFVGLNKVQLRGNKIDKLYPEIYLDFNAIAKGYLVDKIGSYFELNNIANYMVEIGGEIRARGKNHKNEYWRIAIENPNFDGTRSFAKIIQLKDESIASSGNYRKYKTAANGKIFVHTINTKTGYAIESDLLGASVIANMDCADVDAYATALMAMGFEPAKEFLNNFPNLKAFLIYADENGTIQTYYTPNLKENLLETNR